jgi:hypothetical protein
MVAIKFYFSMNHSKKYSDVQFFGHVLCTTPQLATSVEGMSDWGNYLGAEKDTDDIAARLSIVETVLEKVITNTNIDHSTTTLKVFTMPEFFWRGITGAYFNANKNADAAYTLITEGLTAIIKNLNIDHENWLFLFGSILTTPDITACQTKNDYTLARAGNDFLDIFHVIREIEGNEKKSLATLMQISDEKIIAENNTDKRLADLLSDMLEMSDQLAVKIVYNRCFIYYANEEISIQKENKSNEDFILNNPMGLASVNQYIQTMVKYPPLHATDNPIATIPNSTFTCGNVSIGVEICLDHSCHRLAKYVEAKTVEPVDIQIVISSGMQLKPESVATKVGGVLFNNDGEYELKDDAMNSTKSHSQLKTCTASGTPYVLSNFIPATQVITLDSPTNNAPLLFPNGLGEIHIYAPVKITSVV